MPRCLNSQSREPSMKHALVAIVSALAVAGAAALHAQQRATVATPKTPWGDPDISGVWTSDAAIGIPMQRPDRFNGRAELTDEEFKEKEQRDAQTRNRAENAIGSFRNDNAWLAKSYRQTSLIVDPPDGKMPAVTPEAEKRRASRDQGTFGAGPFDKPEDFTMYDRCITRGIIGSVLPVVYGNGNRIIQAPGQVIISYEMVHDTRVIYTDGRPHLPSKIRQLLGDSRGHWEGNTLVIETTNFTDQTSIGGGNGHGIRHSADLKITERITRVDKDELRYEVRVDDPKTYVKPFTLSLPLTSPPGYVLLPYECHEGNYMLRNSLSAEREEDKLIAADLAKGIVRRRKNIQQNLDAGARPIPGRTNPNDDVEQ